MEFSARRISFLLLFTILLYTLIGLSPLSVFSEELSSETELELVNDDNGSATTTGLSLSNQPSGDTYKRESLINDNVYRDFVVGPGKFEVELSPGESTTVALNVSNRMGETKRFRLEFEDVAGSESGEQSVMLLGDQRGPYTLKDYLEIPYMEFDLEHAKKAIIPVTITLPADAEPGGHYGTVVISTVTQKGSEGDETVAPSTPIVSRIGALFFIKSPGEELADGSLKEFSTKGNQTVFTKPNIDFTLVYENTGSVHLNPYGEMRVFNMIGDEVGYQELTPWFALPDSVRLREFTWSRDFLIGRYTAKAYINRGYDDIVDEASIVFWIVFTKLVKVVAHRANVL